MAGIANKKVCNQHLRGVLQLSIIDAITFGLFVHILQPQDYHRDGLSIS